MILHQGVYLPDGETHLVDWMTKSGEIVDGKGTYQIRKLRVAVSYCERTRTAVHFLTSLVVFDLPMHADHQIFAHRVSSAIP